MKQNQSHNSQSSPINTNEDTSPIQSPSQSQCHPHSPSSTIKPPQEDYSSTKHRHSPQCLNKCIKWKLFANLKHDTGLYSYSFTGNSLFFKRLEASILNILQNNYVNNNERSPTKNCLKAFADNSDMQLSLSNNCNTTNLNINPNENPISLHDYLNINFPIDNSEFNFLILDSNLGIADNLNNIFFLEFDLNNSNNKANSKESIKFLREINDYCVDREIEFTLNGLLHNVPLFKNDLKFTVEYRKFIKSIQFRIQTYKTQVNNKRKTTQSGHWKGGDKKGYYTRNNFFAKILSNFNLGIEFTKPSNEGYENYHTNFNSIVNSNIQISKLYLEVSIPKMFIGNSINLASMVSNDNTISNNQTKGNSNNTNTNKDKANESSTSDNSGQSVNNTNTNTNTNINNNIYCFSNNNQTSFTLNQTIDNKDKTIPMSMPIPMPMPMTMTMNMQGEDININQINNIPIHNDFNRMLYKQQNSPTMTIRNNLSMNSKYHRNFYGSPLSVKPMTNIVYSPPGYMNPMIPPQFIPGLATTVSSPLHNSNGNNSNNNSNNGNQPQPMHQPLPFQQGRKFSEQLYDKLREHPLSKMTGPFNHTPMMPYNPDQLIPSVPILNKFISPSDMQKISFNFPSPNHMYIPINPMIQTISQKAIDWENISNNNNNSNNNIDDQRMAIRREYKNQFVKENEGQSNLSLFIKAATFHIKKNQIDSYNSMDLLLFFSYFTHSSLFGLEVFYYINNSINQCIYTSTLSSFELSITSKEHIEAMISNLIKAKVLNEEEINSDEENEYYKEIELDNQNPNLKLKVSQREIVIEYYESRLPHIRYIFIKQIEHIMRILYKTLGPLSLNCLDSSSWFSILWSPIKSMKISFLTSSFLSYYRFNTNIITINNSNTNTNNTNVDADTNNANNNNGEDTNTANDKDKDLEIPLIGVLPIKLNNPLFLSKVSSNTFIGPCGVLNTENPMMIKQISDNVYNTIIKNKAKTSIDYDYYLKNLLKG